MILINVAHQQEINNSRVFPFGIIINQIGFFEISQPGDDAVDNLINAHGFADHAFEFREKGVLIICFVKDITAVFFRVEEAGFGKLIEFFSNGIGGNLKFFGQFSKICPRFGVKEKPGQKFDPDF